MPCPGTLDNGVERLELWSPTKLLFDFFGRSDEPRRIARSTWFFNYLDLSPGDFATRRNSLLNTGAAASAKVVEAAGGRAKRQNVRVRKIDDMNVVANACSIGRLVIGPVDFEIGSLTEPYLQHGG